jgi:hypothetical protein
MPSRKNCLIIQNKCKKAGGVPYRIDIPCCIYLDNTAYQRIQPVKSGSITQVSTGKGFIKGINRFRSRPLSNVFFFLADHNNGGSHEGYFS